MPCLRETHFFTIVRSLLVKSLIVRSLFIRLFLVAGLAIPQTSLAADVEYQIKASYLYNFLQFVNFPKESLTESQEIHVCILGVDLFGDALDEIDGASTPQGTLKISRLGPYKSSTPVDKCNVLYFSISENAETETVMGQIDPRRILTISEYSPFIPYGGLIELYRKKDSIRFRVNENLVKETHFKVAAQLVQLGVN